MKHSILSSVQKHSSMFLSIAAAGGVAVTAILAAKETPKAMKLLEKAKAKKENLTKLDEVTVVAPAYIQAVISGVLTVFCIFGANMLSKKQQATLASAYALLDNSFKNYRNKVNELYGEEADCKVRESISKERNPVKVNDPTEAVSADQMLFYEEYSDEYFWRTMEEVIEAEYHFNRNFILRGKANLNEFYDFLGIPRTEEGEIIGWSADAGLAFYGYQWVDFVHELVQSDDPDTPSYMIISFPFEPVNGYDTVDWY